MEGPKRELYVDDIESVFKVNGCVESSMKKCAAEK